MKKINMKKIVKGVITIAKGFVCPVSSPVVGANDELKFRSTLKGVKCSTGTVETWSEVFKSFKEFCCE